jgi:hypothetical protein
MVVRILTIQHHHINKLADSPALPRYFSNSKTREYAPVLHIPGDCCAGYYQSDPPGYLHPAPDRKMDLPDICPCTPITWVFIFPVFYQAGEGINSMCVNSSPADFMYSSVLLVPIRCLACVPLPRSYLKLSFYNLHRRYILGYRIVV